MNENRPIVYVFKLRRSHQKLIQRITLVALMLILANFFLTFNFTNWMAFLRGTTLISIMMIGIGFFFFWSFISGKLRFRPQIIDNKPCRQKQPKPIQTESTPLPQTPIQTTLTQYDKMHNWIDEQPNTNYPIRTTADATSYILLIIALLIIQLLSIWALDTSITAILTGGTMTNGFYNVLSPAQMYHICIGMIIISTMFIIYFALRVMNINWKPTLSTKLPSRLNLYSPVPTGTHITKFNFIASHMALLGTGFTLIALILGLANPQGQVNFFFNLYNENIIEVALFAIIFGILIINARRVSKTYRAQKRKK